MPLEELRQLLNTKYNFNYQDVDQVIKRLSADWCVELNQRYIDYELDQ